MIVIYPRGRKIRKISIDSKSRYRCEYNGVENVSRSDGSFIRRRWNSVGRKLILPDVVAHCLYHFARNGISPMTMWGDGLVTVARTTTFKQQRQQQNTQCHRERYEMRWDEKLLSSDSTFLVVNKDRSIDSPLKLVVPLTRPLSKFRRDNSCFPASPSYPFFFFF